MANTKSAAKRALQTVTRTARNKGIRTGVRNEAKKTVEALASGKKDAVKAAYATFASHLDKAAKRGVIHKNAVNRRKSRLSKALAAVA